ncbi:glycosyltransferase family 4 protein [Microcoleus sp. LEGE 07076]|uniref:glycosyltransferase family 4 protein n=1 Tax=Microcoleus sp. LEGE 07076 TaxID=915322 RepID=UPI00187FCDD9|nr:glycosyltransferase family 1 protein [Microcoleus sp. LEGE 07076]MBE9187916.1 glycosyltransferase family 4 protein [Microcoleus sp. LEGE 07076]
MSHPQSNLLINLSFLIPQPTGLAIYAKNLFPHLKTLNPTLLTAEKFPNNNCYEIPANLTPEQGTKGHINRLLWTQTQIPKIYKKLKSNLLFSPIPEAPLFAGCRYIITVHDLIALRFPRRLDPLTPYHRYYIPQVLRQAEHIICDSDSTANDITNFCQIPSSLISRIFPGYDASFFKFLDLPTSNYFLYMGRHNPHKNVQRVVAAFAALPKNSEYELWITGSEDQRYTPLLKAQVQELGLVDRVKFLDYLPAADLPKVINRAIALVFPSLWEGFGLPVLEAMACGTPVITSNLSSMPEVAGDGARLVNPYSIQEIASAMQELATDAKARSHLRQLGLARAKQFSWEKTGRETAAIVDRYL